ncbi:MAG: hypothetical protein NTU66_01475 [Elusimicrobia bacterium]|nr:hypothetical protein [Elusimicrobiota bacterium]
MKKVLYILSLCLITSSNSFGANPFDEFKNQISGVATAIAQKNLDNLAKDMGALISGGSFHQAKVLGFPGLDIGIQAPIVTVNKDNAIVKAAGIDTVPLPLIQVEIGLPGKTDVIGRFSSYADSSLVGVGLRYGLYKGSLPGVPSVSVQSVYNTLTVAAAANKFKATSFSTSLIASVGLLVIDPYVGFSYDMTSVEPDASIISGMKGNANNTRIEGGVNISLLPLTYIKVGAVLCDSVVGYDLGCGIKF